MTVHELINELLKVPNQEAEVKGFYEISMGLHDVESVDVLIEDEVVIAFN